MRRPPEISVVIGTRNRRERLLRTLASLRRGSPGPALEIVVVDNASEDGTASAVRAAYPGALLISLDRNTGVEAFNVGAAAASGRHLLILDDDATPDDGSLRWAHDHLDRHPRVGAVSLHPRHPADRASEWPFLKRSEHVRGWPMLMAGFLVRRAAWRQAGGFEVGFYLYVNDTDLALKLLALGWEVHCDPGRVVWHETSTGVRRPLRWFELATRNRVWMARRHLRGVSAVAGAALAWAEAHLRAGTCVHRHAASVRGAIAGWRTPAPRLPAGVDPAGDLFWRLVAVRLGRSITGGARDRG